MNGFDPTQHLTVDRKEIDGIAVFSLNGECDMHTAPYARLEITPVLQSGRPAVIDITNVGFMDSAGYGMLVGLAHIAQDRGTKFTVAAPPSGIVLTGLRILKVDRVLSISTSLEEAVAAAK
ncbi:MAG TPA: STAS domain-containing protein [Armatimonadota bacterium]